MANKTAIGLMSGTSMDGVDAAVLITDGETIAGFGPRRFRPYVAGERAVLRRFSRRSPQARRSILPARACLPRPNGS